MKINYVTGNELKFKIAQAYFEKAHSPHELTQLRIDPPEIQDESVEEVARQAAVWAAKEVGEPCLKLDVGFFIPTLGGFPGPFVKYINEWLTQENILSLLDDQPDRSAYFEDVTAIGYPDGTSVVFSSKSMGSIARKSNPEQTKWPVNQLFIPDGYDRALGSLSQDEQVRFWGDGNWPELVSHLETESRQPQ